LGGSPVAVSKRPACTSISTVHSKANTRLETRGPKPTKGENQSGKDN